MVWTDPDPEAVDKLNNLNYEWRLRRLVSKVYNNKISEEEATRLLEDIPSKVFLRFIFDMCNRVDGCYRFNETFLY